MIDVDLVDASNVHSGNGIRDGVRTNTLVESIAVSFGKKLGITQAANSIRRIENTSGRNDGSEERSATNFIYARYEFCAGRPREFLKFQSALETLEEPQLSC